MSACRYEERALRGAGGFAGATASGAGRTTNPATVGATPTEAAVSPAVWTKYKTGNGKNMPVPTLSVAIAVPR